MQRTLVREDKAKSIGAKQKLHKRAAAQAQDDGNSHGTSDGAVFVGRKHKTRSLRGSLAGWTLKKTHSMFATT